MLITLSRIKNLKPSDKIFYINNEPLIVESIESRGPNVWIKFEKCHPILESPNKKVFKVIDLKQLKRGGGAIGQ